MKNRAVFYSFYLTIEKKYIYFIGFLDRFSKRDILYSTKIETRSNAVFICFDKKMSFGFHGLANLVAVGSR
jgi:hypothetical protein